MQKFRVMIIFIIFILLSALINAQSNSSTDVLIYFQQGETLYKIIVGETTPQIVTTDLSATLRFSNTGQYAAYRDESGIWISSLEDWQPVSIVDQMPSQSFALNWMPDDSRLIFRALEIPSDISDEIDLSEETIAYNLLNQEIETWVWGDCNELGRINDERRFVLICTAYIGLESYAPQRIAVDINGEFSAYDPSEFTILVSDMTIYPRPFDWHISGETETIVYIDLNPEYVSDSQLHSFYEVFYSSEGDQIETLNSSRRPGIDRRIALSPDSELVAYTVRCDEGGMFYECIQVSSLSTGDIVANYTDTIRVQSILDIEWSDTDSTLIVLVNLTSNDHKIVVFDRNMNQIYEYELNGITSGAVAVREE